MLEPLLKLKRTNSKNPDFIKLVSELDTYLKTTDGDDHDFYHQFNGIENLNHTVVAYWNSNAIGCGAFKQYDESSAEIKRMYVHPGFRGKKVATAILKELEKWSMEEGFYKCILETGKRQEEAVAFYQNLDYKTIPNFGQYEKMENSLCFIKELS